MSKIFQKFKKLIISLFIVITLCGFAPTTSNAATWKDSVLGGPILMFCAFLGDVTIGTLHNFVLNINTAQTGIERIAKVFLTDTVLLYPDDEMITKEGGLLYAGDLKAEEYNKFKMDEFDTEALGLSQRSEDDRNRLTVQCVVASQAVQGMMFGGPVGSMIAVGNIALAAIDYTSEVTMDIPNIMVCPENIFGNKLPMFDVNFVNPGNYLNGGYGGYHLAFELRDTVASWYRAFRNIAVVALLTILVYIGIRIIIGSTAQDKAKYKERLKDWAIGLCLVFAMHYIMAGILFVTDGVTNLLAKINTNNEYVVEISGVPSYTGKFQDVHSIDDYWNAVKESVGEIADDLGLGSGSDGDSTSGRTIKVKENLMGYVRLMAELRDFGTSFGYTVMYLVLVIFTVMFVIKYIKRVLYMAFFTMIAPLVAMTYPLDKLSDGKAQGFSMWFREFLMNALIQPVHLLIYTVFVGSASQLVRENVFYGIIVLAFMLPAEKLIRKMFRFDRGETTGSWGDIAGGALALQGLKTISNIGKNNAKQNKEKDDKVRVHKSNRKFVEEAWGNGNSSNGGIIPPVGGTTPSGGGTTPPVGGITPSGGGTIPPVGGITPPVGGTTPPVGGITPSGGGTTPPVGGTTSPVGGTTPPGGTTPQGGTTQQGVTSTTSGGIRTKKSGGKPPLGSTPPLTPNSGKIVRPKQIYTRKTKQTKNGNTKLVNPFFNRNGSQIGGFVGRAGDSIKSGLSNNKRRIIKGAVGAVARGFMGATGATLGFAAGIATGDLSKVAGYTSAGIIAGSTIGKKTADFGENVFDAGLNAAATIRDVYEEEAYGLEQAQQMKHQRENEKAKKQMMNDSEAIRIFKDVAAETGVDLDTVMDYAWDYKEQAGIDDYELIAKGLKLENTYANDPGVTHESMMGVMQVAQHMTADSIMDEKKRTGLEKSLIARVGGDVDLARQYLGYAADAVGEKATWDAYLAQQRAQQQVAQQQAAQQQAAQQQAAQQQAAQQQAAQQQAAQQQPAQQQPAQQQAAQQQTQPKPRQKTTNRTTSRKRGGKQQGTTPRKRPVKGPNSQQQAPKKLKTPPNNGTSKP